jgi:hypothetical protein
MSSSIVDSIRLLLLSKDFEGAHFTKKTEILFAKRFDTRNTAQPCDGLMPM